MMNARMRRELVTEMVQEYDLSLVKALLSTISEKTGTSCSEAAEIVVSAWQRSKEPDVQAECYDYDIAAHAH